MLYKQNTMAISVIECYSNDSVLKHIQDVAQWLVTRCSRHTLNKKMHFELYFCTYYRKGCNCMLINATERL